MKSALIVVGSPESNRRKKAALRLLGYIPYVASSFDAALNVIKMTKFDLVIIPAPTRPADRRSFADEITQVSSRSTVILVTDSHDIYMRAKAGEYSGLAAVAKSPCSVDRLWRILEFESDELAGRQHRSARISERRTKPPGPADHE